MTSCGDSAESVAEDKLDVIKEATEIVKGVNDGDDASDAIEDINNLKDELEELGERAEAIGKDWSDEEKKENKKMVEEKYGKEFKKLEGDLRGELAKLPSSGTVGAGDVAKAVRELMSLMD